MRGKQTLQRMKVGTDLLPEKRTYTILKLDCKKTSYLVFKYPFLPSSVVVFAWLRHTKQRRQRLLIPMIARFEDNLIRLPIGG